MHQDADGEKEEEEEDWDDSCFFPGVGLPPTTGREFVHGSAASDEDEEGADGEDDDDCRPPGLDPLLLPLSWTDAKSGEKTDGGSAEKPELASADAKRSLGLEENEEKGNSNEKIVCDAEEEIVPKEVQGKEAETRDEERSAELLSVVSVRGGETKVDDETVDDAGGSEEGGQKTLFDKVFSAEEEEES